MRNLKIFALASAAVAMLFSCQKGTDDVNSPEVQGTFTVTANYTEPVADDTRTAFVDGENPYVKWLTSDKIRVYEFIDGAQNAYFNTAENGTHLSDDAKTATFDVSLYGDDKDGATSYCYTAVYPENGVDKGSGFYYFEIPANQELTEERNFATGSDILIGKPVNMTSRISTTNLEVQFKRPGTVVALTLKGITAGETISSVKITAPSSQKIAGRSKVNLLTGEVPEADKAYYGGTNVITLNCGDAVVATGTDVFYFRCLDGTWASGSEVSINVETDAATYSKTVNSLPKDYVFADGGLTKFGFQNMNREAKSSMPVYEKYTGDLVEGDYIICSGTTAMKNGISSDRATYETVEVTNDKIKTNSKDIVWHISQSGDYWTIYNESVKKYAASTGAKSKLQLLDSGTDDKSLWTVSGSESYEFVNKQNNANGVNANLRYNSGYGFACYSTSTGSALTLYINPNSIKEKLAAPVLGTPTVNHFTKSITITWTDVANATVYEVSCGDEKQNVNPGVRTCTFSGLSAGKHTISVKAVDGTGTYTPATATTEEITLGDPTITLSTTEVVNVAAEGGDFDDITYELALAEDKDLFWTCDGTVVTEVIADSGEIVYTVSENSSEEGRDGWIKVMLNGATQTITISQLGKGAAPDPVLTKLKDINDVPAAGVTAVTESEVYSLANAELDKLTITPDGLIVTAASSNALGSITYTVAANTGEARTGTITISIGGADSIVINVNQETGVKKPEVIYFTGFETNFTTGTNYQGTVTSGPEGQQWKIYYGNFSTTDKINGSNSAALRLYTSNNYGYLQTEFNLPNVTEVKYKAKAQTSNSAKILLNTFYSIDSGSNWVQVDNNKEISKDASDYSFVVNGNGYSNVRIKFAISESSTKPSSKNAQLTIDDIEIWGIK